MSENSPTPEPPQNQPAQPNPPQPAPPQRAPEKKSNGEKLRKLNSPFFIWPAAIVLAILLYLGLALLADTLTHESTDDAFIAGHIVSIAPRISGQVSAVYVLDNQLVHSNDLLVEIDPSDYATTLSQKQAAQHSAESNFKAAVAGYNLMGVKVKTAEATAKESKADADAAEATAARAKADFMRAQTLRTNETISAQEFDQARAATDEAEANFNSANQKAGADESKVAEANAQLAAAKAESDAVFSQLNQSKTEVDSANLNLSYAKIFAPGDGRVTRKEIEVGDYLQTGQQIFSIVPTEVWVVANFKESQLRKMSPGQHALVEIDALGGRKFRAHVDSVQAGSGAAFSLLPPENATGNFVKVIQRVPVKILFDEALPADHTIGPGLSVTPSVQVSSFNFPDWAIALIAIILAAVSAIGFHKFLNRKSEA
ncbi:MAG TPA: HlyD family secretion protein [Verrucomicrobiae bacterium]|jgi:membrane fusion protein (multidrug efflux system)|nr:HlyD family secretion protein [Verrucomicrobiae bacterium]